MSIFTNVKSFKRGVAKAERDWKLVQAYEDEHDKRHAEIGEYDCNTIGHKFYSSLGQDVNRDDLWESGGYSATTARHKQELALRKDPMAILKSIFGDAIVVPFQVAPDETEEQINQRINQAFADTKALAQLEEEFGVSGNEDED